MEDEAGEDNKEAAHMLVVQLMNQSDVKVDVDEGQDDVEGQQLQHWGHKVLDKPRILYWHFSWSFFNINSFRYCSCFTLIVAIVF